jgi:hypothetical protein
MKLLLTHTTTNNVEEDSSVGLANKHVDDNFIMEEVINNSRRFHLVLMILLRFVPSSFISESWKFGTVPEIHINVDYGSSIKFLKLFLDCKTA